MFPEYKKLDLVKICSEISLFWKESNIFEKSVTSKDPQNRFVFSILEFTYRLTDPFLNKIRRYLPNLGAFDISPIVLLLLIWFIELCMKLYVAPIIFN